MELGLPSTGKLAIRRPASYVYNLLTNREVADAAGNSIPAVIPQPLNVATNDAPG